MPSTQRLPVVNFRPVSGAGTSAVWHAVAIAAGFADTLCNDDLDLLGLCVAESLSEFADEDLASIVRSFSELQKRDIRRRASRRACGRSYPRVAS
jgi:hypothetical protein